jgi:hypothetical protein
VFLDLVQNKWKTRQALSTGNDGTCEMEAFAGDYTVRAGDATIRATVEPGVSSMVTLALSR